MKALTDERWQEIRDMVNQPITKYALNEVLQQHDHLAAQIKLLADYIMSERSDDPAWAQGEGACAMAVAIMKREGDVEIAYKGLQDHKNALVKENEALKINNKIGEKIDTLIERFETMISESYSTKIDLQMTRNMIETAEKENLAFPPFKIGK